MVSCPFCGAETSEGVDKCVQCGKSRASAEKQSVLGRQSRFAKIGVSRSPFQTSSRSKLRSASSEKDPRRTILSPAPSGPKKGLGRFQMRSDTPSFGKRASSKTSEKNSKRPMAQTVMGLPKMKNMESKPPLEPLPKTTEISPKQTVIGMNSKDVLNEIELEEYMKAEEENKNVQLNTPISSFRMDTPGQISATPDDDSTSMLDPSLVESILAFDEQTNEKTPPNNPPAAHSFAVGNEDYGEDNAATLMMVSPFFDPSDPETDMGSEPDSFVDKPKKELEEAWSLTETLDNDKPDEQWGVTPSMENYPPDSFIPVEPLDPSVIASEGVLPDFSTPAPFNASKASPERISSKPPPTQSRATSDNLVTPPSFHPGSGSPAKQPILSSNTAPGIGSTPANQSSPFGASSGVGGPQSSFKTPNKPDIYSDQPAPVSLSAPVLPKNIPKISENTSELNEPGSLGLRLISVLSSLMMIVLFLIPVTGSMPITKMLDQVDMFYGSMMAGALLGIVFALIPGPLLVRSALYALLGTGMLVCNLLLEKDLNSPRIGLPEDTVVAITLSLLLMLPIGLLWRGNFYESLIARILVALGIVLWFLQFTILPKILTDAPKMPVETFFSTVGNLNLDSFPFWASIYWLVPLALILPSLLAFLGKKNSGLCFIWGWQYIAWLGLLPFMSLTLYLFMSDGLNNLTWSVVQQTLVISTYHFALFWFLCAGTANALGSITRKLGS